MPAKRDKVAVHKNSYRMDGNEIARIIDLISFPRIISTNPNIITQIVDSCKPNELSMLVDTKIYTQSGNKGQTEYYINFKLWDGSHSKGLAELKLKDAISSVLNADILSTESIGTHTSRAAGANKSYAVTADELHSALSRLGVDVDLRQVERALNEISNSRVASAYRPTETRPGRF